MLKGVNKRIVEINNTGNEYFEKAILFIKPEAETLPKERINHMADDYLGKLGQKKKKQSIMTTLIVLLVIALIVAVAVFVLIF